MKKILYLQFTNPGGYPPLEHSSRILAERGWKVVFLGTGARGAGNLEFPARPNIQVKRWRFVEGGVLQKTHYILFGLWCFGVALLWRPNWIYASDPLICPIALFIQRITGVKLVYHEHDSPDSEDRGEGRGDRGKKNGQNGIFQIIVMGARREVARRAEVCVLPNEERVEIFKKQTGTDRPVECVWNVPAINEIGPQKKKPDPQQPLKVFYGGSLSPERLPRVVMEEIAKFQGRVVLEIVGYETYSARKYLDGLIKDRENKEKKIIYYHGTLPERVDLLRVADRCEAALCLMPMSKGDINMRTMAGASNKPFDAMARGLAVVVSDLEEWKSIYLGIGDWPAQTYPCPSGTLAPQMKEYPLSRGDCEKGIEESPKFRIPESGKGYGIAINPESRESIRAGLEWMLNNREKLWEMGERGRQKIQNEWNYETIFKSVLRRLEKE